MRILLIFFFASILFYSCRNDDKNSLGGKMSVSDYFNYGDSGVQSAGIKMIPIKTPVGDFKEVWQ
jgi:proline iminopeptidase